MGPPQLGDPPVNGVDSTPDFIRIGLALLALPPVGQPLVEGLGAVLSYSNFEDLTFQRRLAVAKDNYTRLKKFLHSRVLTLATRVRMWLTCIWTSLTYSLVTVGVTPASTAKLRGVVATHWRAIARSPRHLTGETTTSLQTRLGLRDPMDLLLELSVAFVNRLHAVRTCEHHIVLQDEHISSQAEWACGMIRTQAALCRSSRTVRHPVRVRHGEFCSLQFCVHSLESAQLLKFSQ